MMPELGRNLRQTHDTTCATWCCAARGVKDVVERRAVVEEGGLGDPWVGARTLRRPAR